MERVWVRALLTVTLLVLLPTATALAVRQIELEPGVHTFAVGSQHFEVETEVTIGIEFDIVTLHLVRGSVTVLDPIGYGWVKLTWLEHSAVIIDDVIEGSQSFNYRNSETGHAERSKMPKHGPTTPAEPSIE